MTASVAAFLDRVRERGVQLPPPLSGALLLAAVRLSEARSLPLRPDLLQVDADGGLALRDGAADADSPYASPELRKGAVLPDDPRAMVYAAGALGYELSTLTTLEPDKEAGPEVQGPLAPVIRKALAQDRKKRWRNLAEMAQAIEQFQAPPTHEEEKLILAAVAQTTGPRKLARIELLQKATAPSPYAPDPHPEAVPVQTPPAVHPLFAQRWDPLEAPPEVFFQSPEPSAVEEPGVVELHEAQVREAHGEELHPVPSPPAAPQRDLLRMLESRLENVARLGSRISALEEQVKLSVPPQPAALAQEIAQLIDQRRSAQSAIQRRVLAAALPVVGGALAGAAVAVFAVLSLRPPPAPPVHPVVAAPVVTPAAVAQQAPPPPVEAQTEAEIPNSPPVAAPSPPRKRAPRKSPAAAEHAAAGDKALRAFNTAAAQTAFETALNEDPSLPAAHRGLGMVYVLQGRNDAAKAEYEKYLLLAPDAPDADQIKRLLGR